MNIILIVSDTYRYDNLFDRAAMPVRTPNLDAFAERAVSMEQFYTGSFPTIPQRTDMTSGRYGWGESKEGADKGPDWFEVQLPKAVAIERVRVVDGQIECQTIGGGPPVGMCGSGILDAIAQLKPACYIWLIERNVQLEEFDAADALARAAWQWTPVPHPRARPLHRPCVPRHPCQCHRLRPAHHTVS